MMNITVPEPPNITIPNTTEMANQMINVTSGLSNCSDVNSIAHALLNFQISFLKLGLGDLWPLFYYGLAMLAVGVKLKSPIPIAWASVFVSIMMIAFVPDMADFMKLVFGLIAAGSVAVAIYYMIRD